MSPRASDSPGVYDVNGPPLAFTEWSAWDRARSFQQFCPDRPPTLPPLKPSAFGCQLLADCKGPPRNTRPDFEYMLLSPLRIFLTPGNGMLNGSSVQLIEVASDTP
jgi:hypothetical protein